jgi:outer membrane protein
MKINNIFQGLIFVLVGILGYCIWHTNTKIPKLGYVRTAVILEKYQGVAEARKVIEKKMEKWQSNVDTLEMNYRHAQDRYNQHYAKLNVREREEFKTSLDKQYKDMEGYVANLERLAMEENRKLTEGILLQVNSFIENYAREKKITLILGVTEEGNILYGDAPIDLTEDILESMNKAYINISK